MIRVATEDRHAGSDGLDARAPREIGAILHHAQLDAAGAVEAALDDIVAASAIAVAALKNGGRLIYAGAGSSGLIAMMDALELPGTYGIDREQIVVLLAGGVDTCRDLRGGPEDDADLANDDADRAGFGREDCVIAIAASGSTPYTCAVARRAIAAGSGLIAVANNSSAPLFDGANVSVLLETAPEVISGSTRMGAGTAQKIALNIFSTLTGIGLGHVHDGYMVNLRADNAKLRVRASRIVSAISGIEETEAGLWLERAEGSAKLAVLMAEGAPSREDAKRVLFEAGDSLRKARRSLKRVTSEMSSD